MDEMEISLQMRKVVKSNATLSVPRRERLSENKREYSGIFPAH